MGLVNRVVEPGEARRSAIALAREIATFPEACMREDRLSMYEGLTLSEVDALHVEYRHGSVAVQAGMMDEVQRFVAGSGRHGSFGSARETDVGNE
jgi:enoyl-CoA hydratase